MGQHTLAEPKTLEAQALMLQLQVDLNLIVRTITEELHFYERLDQLLKELGGPPTAALDAKAASTARPASTSKR